MVSFQPSPSPSYLNDQEFKTYKFFNSLFILFYNWTLILKRISIVCQSVWIIVFDEDQKILKDVIS